MGVLVYAIVQIVLRDRTQSVDLELQEGMIETENPFRIFLSQVRKNEELSQDEKNKLISLYTSEHQRCEGQSVIFVH